MYVGFIWENCGLNFPNFKVRITARINTIMKVTQPDWRSNPDSLVE
jgi:hypothetical protein